nr:hypothetical protein [Tanacetum cinerariifolium]
MNKRDEDIFCVNDLDGDEVIVDVAEQAKESVNVADQDKEVVADKDIINDITLAKALMEIKSAKPKADKVVIQEPEQEQAPTSIASSKQPSHVKDNDKGIMVELETPMKKKDQISLDEELAYKLQAEEQEERIAREKAQKVKEVNIDWDDIKAKIDADYELAQRLQVEEQEALTDAEKAKLFMEFLEKRRKFFAAKRAKEKRNIPPIKSQQRSIMSTYLKNMDGWKLKKESTEKAEAELTQEDDGDDVTIDATPLSSKPPTIINYKIHKEGKKNYFQIFRADGNL